MLLSYTTKTAFFGDFSIATRILKLGSLMVSSVTGPTDGIKVSAAGKNIASIGGALLPFDPDAGNPKLRKVEDFTEVLCCQSIISGPKTLV